MEKWDVFLVISSIVGLFVTVTQPVLKLNATMSRLDNRIELQEQRVNDLEEQVNELEEKKTKRHGELWHKQHEQDRILQNHEQRLHELDGKWFHGN